MPKLSAADLAENDIVVVEAAFTRWKKATDKKKKTWPSWDVSFELQSIALLHSPPPELEPAVVPTAAAGPVFAI